MKDAVKVVAEKIGIIEVIRAYAGPPHYLPFYHQGYVQPQAARAGAQGNEGGSRAKIDVG